jgi:type II secretory pathway pseudopilin PulG
MRKLRRDSNWEQGFGMIDMLVATVLLGIAVAVMMLGFAYASAGTRENRGRVQAIMLAQESLENLKQNDGVSTTLDLKVMKPEDEGELIGAGNGYTLTRSGVEYTVSAIATPTNGLSKLQAVTLTVAWTEAGVNRSLSMVEYIYLN